MRQNTPKWRLVQFGLGLTLLLFSLAVVWMNISLVDLSYRIEELQRTLDQEVNLNDKLKLERLNLVSAQRLEGLSRTFSLYPPETSEIRRLKP